MKTIIKRTGTKATSTELLRMNAKRVPLDRVVDFWRNPVEKTLCVLLDDVINGELIYC